MKIGTPYGKAFVRPSGTGVDISCGIKNCTWHSWLLGPTAVDSIKGEVANHFEGSHWDVTLLHRCLMSGMKPHDYGKIRRDYEYGPIDLPCCAYSEEHPIHHAEEIRNG